MLPRQALECGDATRCEEACCPEAAPYEGPELDDREVRILQELYSDGEGRTAFQGLRRRLGLHQQALTRTLRRLERYGVVDRDDAGYGLTWQGHAALRGRPLPTHARESMTLAQALLPPDVDAASLARRLERRWFGNLRWYGRTDAPGETTLAWLSVDGDAQVRLRIVGGALTLEASAPPGEEGDAYGATRALLAALAEAYPAGAVRGAA